MQEDTDIYMKICGAIRTVTDLPDDFHYDYPLFERFDGKPHLALSSIRALELVVLIYETWGVDVPMEDIPKLYSVNAIADYLAEAGAFL